VIPPVSVTAAGLSLFFNVTDFAAGRHLAVFADDAPASEGRKAQKPNETHHNDPLMSKSCAAWRVIMVSILASDFDGSIVTRPDENHLRVQFIG
jgi:hypothetical protein